MSRVRKPEKFMNSTKYDSSVTNAPKMVRIHSENEDYHKCKTLAHWLFVKYDISYGTFRNKSKKRRDELREEFKQDTGIDILAKHEARRSSYVDDFDDDDDYWYGYLADIGVPMTPMGVPLGIDFDD